jgi:hypothetical protein
LKEDISRVESNIDDLRVDVNALKADVHSIKEHLAYERGLKEGRASFNFGNRMKSQIHLF